MTARPRLVVVLIVLICLSVLTGTVALSTMGGI